MGFWKILSKSYKKCDFIFYACGKQFAQLKVAESKFRQSGSKAQVLESKECIRMVGDKMVVRQP